MIGDFVRSWGFIWCQFFDCPLYLYACDVEVCSYGFWIIGIWYVAKLCCWWWWEEGSTQGLCFLDICCCFSFQCRDICVGRYGVEIFVDFPYVALVCFAYEILPCISFGLFHFALEDFSVLLPSVFIFPSFVFNKSSRDRCACFRRISISLFHHLLLNGHILAHGVVSVIARLIA